MKKSLLVLLLCGALLWTAGCGKSTDEHTAQSTVSDTTSVSESDTVQQTETAQDSSAAAAESSSQTEYPQEASDDYPYDIDTDRATFDASKIDIVVGDKLYMTQINDWYMNFEDYAGKTVEIEGYYMVYNSYTFVGRNGPTCPYCTGGYVNFEFKSDEDLSALVSESSWIKVTGILREGTMYPGSGQAPQPFCYIEAMSVEKMAQVGIDTITD
ncbi:MAG: hypothetical protein VB055_02300 [Oscillospiraceae bacterium]|nr:hypothetical protein [Oscillospiraceae bacterium]